jgi:hypothetical protein
MVEEKVRACVFCNSFEPNTNECVPEGIRLWLDDTRKPPFGYEWVKTADECIQFLKDHHVLLVSLDHDLADEHYAYADGSKEIPRDQLKEKTGYEVLEWTHEFDAWVPEIHVHSLNAKGVQDMMTKLRNRAPEWVVYRRVAPREI